MNILNYIGNTPLVKLNGIKRAFNLKANLYAKIEYFNPTGSIKDRAAVSIVKNLAKQKLIKKGDYLVEASSGNMGVSISMIGKMLGYKPVIVLYKGVSKTKKDIIKGYGGKIFDNFNNIAEAQNHAKILGEKTNYYYINQFQNKFNELGYKPLGKEIESQLGFVDYFVCGIGSGGTIVGCGGYLKAKGAKIIGVEPIDKKAQTIEGLSYGINNLATNSNVIDIKYQVDFIKAKYGCKLLAKYEGLFVGYSSGAVLFAVLNMLSIDDFKSNIVMIFADSYKNYLSS